MSGGAPPLPIPSRAAGRALGRGDNRREELNLPIKLDASPRARGPPRFLGWLAPRPASGAAGRRRRTAGVRCPRRACGQPGTGAGQVTLPPEPGPPSPSRESNSGRDGDAGGGRELRWCSGGVRDGRAPYPGSGGSWCFWRRGRAALLLPWGPGGALGRGPKRAGLAKEEA